MEHDFELIFVFFLALHCNCERFAKSRVFSHSEPWKNGPLFWVMNPPIPGKSRCEVGFILQTTNTIRRSRRSSTEDPHVSRTGDVATKMAGNLELPESGDTKGQKCAEVAILIHALGMASTTWDWGT